MKGLVCRYRRYRYLFTGVKEGLRVYDAIVALALVAELQATDRAVIEAAKRFSKQLPRRYRPLMFDIINSPAPLRQVRTLVTTLPDEVLQSYRDAEPEEPVAANKPLEQS
ncbi:hypothetical protein HMPREF1487_09567 [Pseudomonas sp. HPB0071]|nr:hypothetical protein HMPREF1487_09567 [Pseudomonas sp. HPB0071]